ncbi:MAG: SUMF1/EgtB/PvdO family nonheme iron enzyme [Planctomycetes bacterium]|nr:SUMF1/EgtB/PvdO family nonheme iron enzyme [Planctomycetota bacterium]
MVPSPDEMPAAEIELGFDPNASAAVRIATAAMLQPIPGVGLGAGDGFLTALRTLGGEPASESAEQEDRRFLRLGEALFDLLTAETRSAIRRALGRVDAHGPLRLVVADEDGARSDGPGRLPWEFLTADGQSLVGRGAVEVLRSTGARRRRSVPLLPVQMLIVVGDHRQFGERVERHIQQAIRAIQDAVTGFASIHVVGQMKVELDRVQQLPCVNATELQQILSEPRWSIVHFIGHSEIEWPPADEAGSAIPGAHGIRVLTANATDAEPLSATRIAQALAVARTARLVVTDCCLANREFAVALSATVDHFLGMNAMVPVEFTMVWAPAFYRELARHESVPAALAAARHAIARPHPNHEIGDRFVRLAAVPCHWRASSSDHPFGNALEARIARYRRAVVERYNRRQNPILGSKPGYKEHEIPHVPLRFVTGPRDPGTKAADLIERGGAWMLLGDPGTGKTSTLRRLAYEFADGTTSDAGPTVIPVLVTLPDLLADSPEADLRTMLRRAMRIDELDEREQRAIAEDLEQDVPGHRLLFLLDGLDEADPEHGRRLVVDLRKKRRDAVVLVASRQHGRLRLEDEDSEAHFGLARVAALSVDEQLTMLSGYLDVLQPAGHDAAALLEKLHEALPDLASTPLFLALAAVLRDQIYEIKGRRALLLRAIDVLLREPHRGRGSDLPASADKLLQVIASNLTAIGQRQSTHGDLRTFLHGGGVRHGRAGSEASLRLSKWLDNNSGIAIRTELGPWRQDADRFLADIENRGVLVREGTVGDLGARWQFWHKSFQEVLTSAVLERMDAAMIEGLFGLIAELVADPLHRVATIASWTEPLAFWVATPTAETDRHARVEQLLALHSGLALRAATYADISDPTLLQRLVDAAESGSGDLLEVLDRLTDDNLCKVRVLEARLQQNRGPAHLFDTDEALQRLAERDSCRTRTGVFPATEAADIALEASDRGLRSRGRLQPDRWHDVAGAASRLWLHVPADPAAKVGRSFWITATPITLELFRSFDPQHEQRWSDPAHPATVTWKEATVFARWLHCQQEALLRELGELHLPPGGCTIRLPTAAEWRHAAGAGVVAGPYPRGVDLHNLGGYAVFDRPLDQGPEPVAGRKPNDFGLYDTLGNVYEWLADRGSDRRCSAVGGAFFCNATHCHLDSLQRLEDDRDLMGAVGFRIVIAGPDGR